MQLVSFGALDNSRVVPGGDPIGTELSGSVEKQVELDPGIAACAGDRELTRRRRRPSA
jgi:hypothetical protein